MELTLGSIAKTVTGNNELLKDLPLELHPLANVQGLSYRRVKKTKPIKARPINTILDKTDSEQSVFEKMLLSTLEGAQTLGRNVFICWGCDNDVWQQTKQKLTDQYTLTDTDEDGWTTWTPKPEAERNGFQVTEDCGFEFGPAKGWSCPNYNTDRKEGWGDRRVVPASVLEDAGINPACIGYPEPQEQYILNFQFGVVNDWIIQRQEDHNDTYRVGERFFVNTHDVLG